MAEQIIGRVSVKVMPDTSDFRRDAERQLERIERQLVATIGTKADLTGAKRDLFSEIRKLNQENRTKDAYKIRLYTALSTANMQEEISKAVRKFQARIDSENRRVKIDADLVAADLIARLDKDSLDDVKRDIDRFRKRVSPVKIPVQLDLSQTGNIATSARIEMLTRPRKVSIIPELDNAGVAKVGAALAALSGARLLSTQFDEIVESLLNLDKNIPIIGTMALAVAGLASWAGTAASNLAALSSSLAQIGPAGLVLPGIFGGIAIGVGTSIVALLDFKKVIPEVAAEFSKLRQALSAEFWAQAEKPIRAFIDKLMPEFSAGVQQTAGELGTWFGNLATSINGAFNGLLGGMFDDLSASIAIAAQGTDSFAGIIATLANVGAGYLPQLAKWFVDIATQFDSFLEKAAADGRLKQWIDTGIANLKTLGSALGSIGSIFAGIAEAATQAGGSTLDMFAESLSKVAAVVNSAPFQTGLIKVLQGAHKAMQDLATNAGPGIEKLFTSLADILATVLPIAGQAIGTLVGSVSEALSDPGVASGIIMMFQGLKEGVAGLAPAFAPLAQALAAIAKLVGTMASAFGPLIAAAITPLAGAVTRLVPAIQPIVELLSGALTQAITSLSPLFEMLVESIAGLLQGGGFTALQAIVAGLLPVITALGQVLVSVLGPVFAALGPILAIVGQAIGQILAALAPLITVLGQLLGAILTPLLAVLGNVVAEVVPKLAAAIIFVVEALIPFIAGLTQVASVIMAVVAPILEWLLGVLGDALVGAIRGVGEVINGFVGVVQGAWNIIAGIFTGDWSRMWDGVKQVAVGVWNLLKGAFDIFINVGLLKVAKLGLALLKDGFALGWQGIKAAAVAVWDFLKLAWSLFLTGLKESPRAALAAIKMIFSEAWSALKSLATEAWKGIVYEVKFQILVLKEVFVTLPGKIKGWLGDLGGILKDAGVKVIKGFISGIGSMFDSVKSKLGELTGKLTSWKGPEDVDRKVLFGAGQLVIGGFIDGLESRFDDVRRSLGDFTNEISSTKIDPIEFGGISGLGDKLKELADGANPDGLVVRQFVYNAAPGNSFSSEEEFFSAAERERAW